jgi:hypothetical protein
MEGPHQFGAEKHTDPKTIDRSDRNVEAKLQVFLSSSINEYIGHRDLIHRQLCATPLIQAFVFEHAPAQAAANEKGFAETYLRKLRQSDIVVLVIGKELRQAVEEEIEASIAYDIPILLFIEERYRDSEHVARILKKTFGKYQTFMRATELSDRVVEAVYDYVIVATRHYWSNR